MKVKVKETTGFKSARDGHAQDRYVTVEGGEYSVVDESHEKYIAIDHPEHGTVRVTRRAVQ